MAEPKNRIIVDGVDFAGLFLFPRIFGAVTASLQPARLIIGLFMVVLLITCGRVWDGVTSPSVWPDGLKVGRWHADSPEAREFQSGLRDVYHEFAPDEAAPAMADRTIELHASTVLKHIARGYVVRSQAATTDEDRARLKSMYELAVKEINRRRPRGAFEGTVHRIAESFGQVVSGAMALSLPAVVAGVGNLFIETPRLLWDDHKWFSVVFAVLLVLIFAVGGGAISRMAACQFAAQERIRISQAIDFSLANWSRLVLAQVLPLLIVLVLCGVIALMGVLMNAPVLDVLGGLLYGLALLLGFFIAFLLLGYLLGFPLLIPAVAVENCDGADAMQRAYAYAVMRPLHLLAYWLIALVGLALGFMLVSVFAVVMLNTTAALFGATNSNSAMSAAGGFGLFELASRPTGEIAASWHERWAGSAIMFWQGLVMSMVVAYVFVYQFSASTIMYILMRRACDGQDVAEIWRPGLIPGTFAPEPRAVNAGENAPAIADGDSGRVD